jgi:hypothetical protein
VAEGHETTNEQDREGLTVIGSCYSYYDCIRMDKDPDSEKRREAFLKSINSGKKKKPKKKRR